MSSLLLTYHVYHFVFGNPDVYDYIGGWIAPALLIAALWYVRRGVKRKRIDDSLVLRLTGWFVLAVVLYVVSYVVVILSQQAEGGRMVEKLYNTIGWATGGAAAGLVIGYYDVRRIHASRQQTEILTENVAVLNRVLRHNIRNDIQVILSRLDMLVEEENEHSREIRERLNSITEMSQEARKLEEIISEDESNVDVTDLSPVLREKTEEIRDSYPEVDLHADIPETVPVLSHEMIDTAFENLLENAVEHNDSDSPRVEVSVSETEEEDTSYVEVRVSDDGPGIPEMERQVLERGQETAME
ncbi:MAG: ATP-binding protein, partial [Halobacteria archaeon]|nr:ATP-binding protein [Halobacteria archaeon]